MKRIKDVFLATFYKGVVGVLRWWGVSNRLISQSIARAYDDGYKAGMMQFAKENLGKNYVKKVKKVINRAYSRENL